MTRPPPAPARAPRRAAARLAAAGLASFGLTLGAGACLDRPVAPASPRTSNAITERVAVESINKIDLLFMIDNSISMADKQSILASAVPDLLRRLITPSCVTTNPDGTSNLAPPGADGRCAAGVPEFEPVADIHIGVVSSSIGGHGGTVCAPEDGGFPDDGGKLLARRDGSGAAGEPVPTYRNLGFLAWDQEGLAGGEQNRDVLQANFATIVKGVGQNGCGFEASLEGWYRFLVDPSPAVFEPTPLDPAGTARVPQIPTLKAVDQKVLQQRADFLRPDSLVAVIALSDENDCSFIEGFYPGSTRGESGLVEPWPEPYLKHLLVGAGPNAQTFALNGFQLNINADGIFDSGTSACKDDPYSPNCFNCGYLVDPMATPEANEAARAAAGCAPFGDPVADAAGYARKKQEYDRVNQRCFKQRERFGFEALHPVQRYIDALTQRKIYDTSGALIALNKPTPEASDAKYFADDNPINRNIGNVVAPKVDNPLFVDLPWRRYAASCTGPGPTEGCDESLKPVGRDSELAQRPAGRVYFAGIVGVPWQDIAVNPTTLASAPGRPGGFQAPGAINWDLILGPALAGRVTEFGDPIDPLMIESITPRVGLTADDPKNIHPITKENLAGPWNRINGHEWTNPIFDDLQYACIFPLNTDVQCNPPPGVEPPAACDCTEAAGQATTSPDARKNPLCETYTAGDATKAGGTGVFTTVQARAKAYPGPRFLEVLKGIGDSAIVASICPEEIREEFRENDNFGYRPAVNAIIDRLKNALKGRCLPRRLDVQDNKTPCLVIEARYGRDESGVSKAPASEIAACQACSAPGYAPLSPELRATLQAQRTETLNDDPTDFECLCQFQQLTPETGLRTCQTDPNDPSLIGGVNGWCYVDPLLAAPEDRAAQEAIVKDCAGAEKRTLRFIGTQGSTGQTADTTSIFITCLGAASNSLPVAQTTPEP